MKRFKIIIFSIFIVMFYSSCSYVHKTMQEPNIQVEFYKSDFIFSEQFTAEATQTFFFGLDFERLFSVKSASTESGSDILPSISSIPIVGGMQVLKPKSTEAFALYNLMEANPGYDVVFYPQYETIEVRPVGLSILVIKTVKVTARLGKLQ